MNYLYCAALLAVVLLSSCGKKADAPLPQYVTIDYYASPYEGEGTKNLIIREGSQAELYGIADTVQGELTDTEQQNIAAALNAVATWDTAYESTLSERFEVVRKIHPQGISSIRRSHGSETPRDVDELLKQLSAVAQRLRAEQQNNAPAL